MIKLDTHTANAIAEKICLETGQNFHVTSIQSISGGDINAAFRLQGETGHYFVKLNQRNKQAMFKAEFIGLQALAQTNTVSVPQPILHGEIGDVSFLVLEHIELHRATRASEQLLGQQLAQLHLQRQGYFGWHIDNTIGSTPQCNLQTSDWITFWRESRLNFQLQLAVSNGYGKKIVALGNLINERLDDFFHGYTPIPSLLHGDLWGGNAASTVNNKPVIFDPACYFGDRETDLAMTELFGGFGKDFYAAYNEVWQLDSGYPIRRNLYNLYHILNHVNLFGSSYISQAEKMMQNLLKTI